MTIGLDSAILNELSGDPGNQNLSEELLAQAALSGNSDVELFTGKEGWEETDKYFNTARHAGYLFGISLIRSGFNEKEKNQQLEFQQAKELCQTIHDALDKQGLLTTSAEVTEGFGGVTSPTDASEPLILNTGAYNIASFNSEESPFYP